MPAIFFRHALMSKEGKDVEYFLRLQCMSCEKKNRQPNKSQGKYPLNPKNMINGMLRTVLNFSSVRNRIQKNWYAYTKYNVHCTLYTCTYIFQFSIAKVRSPKGIRCTMLGFQLKVMFNIRCRSDFCKL